MASQNDHSDERPSSDATRLSSCRRRKNFGSGSFVNDMRDRIHEFLHSSMDEHRTCLKDSMQKVSFVASHSILQNKSLPNSRRCVFLSTKVIF